MRILDRPTEKQIEDRYGEMTVEELIEEFPKRCLLEIYTVFPGEFRIGYRHEGVNYAPGTPSYYPLKEALQRCLWAFQDRFGHDEEAI